MEEGDKIHKSFMSSLKQSGFILDFRDKYDTLSFMHFAKNPGQSELFEVSRHYPNFLKLLVYGRNDNLF